MLYAFDRPLYSGRFASDLFQPSPVESQNCYARRFWLERHMSTST